jgi:hypothetical protein
MWKQVLVCNMAAAPAPDRVELRVQPMPNGEYDAVVDRLDGLDRRGLIDGYSVRTWDRYVDVDDRIARRLSGRETTSTTAGVGRMGVERDVRRLPRAALVEYRGDRVVAVTTSEEGLLDRLAAVDATGSEGGRLLGASMGGAD